MKILIKLSNHIISTAFKDFLGKEDNNKYKVNLADNKNHSGNFNPDIILVDFINLSMEWYLKYSNAKLVLIDTCLCLKHEDIIKAFLHYNIHGVISADINTSLFKKMLDRIYDGEILMDNDVVKTLLLRVKLIDTPGNIAKDDLSKREKEIIKLVCNGLSNKEVAQKIFLSEQTVKHHISNIFRKLNIHTRSQLILRIINSNSIEF